MTKEKIAVVGERTDRERRVMFRCNSSWGLLLGLLGTALALIVANNKTLDKGTGPREDSILEGAHNRPPRRGLGEGKDQQARYDTVLIAGLYMEICPLKVGEISPGWSGP